MRVRPYSDTLSASVNRKGVLDVDTVKGCRFGMASDPAGCYGACYAASGARFRGLDFARAVVRRTKGAAHADSIVAAVKAAPFGFFRVGTMGDPSHDWEHTTSIVKWLAPYAAPVIVTKHWRIASDRNFESLVAVGAILNTSVSALDTQAQLAHRTRQIDRYATLGGVSVARVVSCDFSTAHPDGPRHLEIQKRLFAGRWPVIDNPLRLAAGHPLVTTGLVKLTKAKDLATERTVSLARSDAYLGRCGPCPDRCGLAFRPDDHPQPRKPQTEMEF